MSRTAAACDDKGGRSTSEGVATSEVMDAKSGVRYRKRVSQEAEDRRRQEEENAEAREGSRRGRSRHHSVGYGLKSRILHGGMGGDSKLQGRDVRKEEKRDSGPQAGRARDPTVGAMEAGLDFGVDCDVLCESLTMFSGGSMARVRAGTPHYREHRDSGDMGQSVTLSSTDSVGVGRVMVEVQQACESRDSRTGWPIAFDVEKPRGARCSSSCSKKARVE
ncbi:hypothetical protein Tco_0957142 [Tanacetum coccineum]